MNPFGVNFSLHLHKEQVQVKASAFNAVEAIIGDGKGWAKEVTGIVRVLPTSGRCTLHVQGSGAMKINGSLIIGG